MKLSQKPKIIYMDDPGYGGPYPYVFACMQDTLKAMGLEMLHLNTASVTLEIFRESINAFKPELLFGFIQDRQQVVKISKFLKHYHPVATINWYQEDPNGIIGKEKSENSVDASESFDMWFSIDRNMLPYWKTKAAFMPPGFDEYTYHNKGLDRCFDVSYIGQLGPEYVAKMYWPYMKEVSKLGKKALFCTERPMGIPLLPKHLERFLRYRKYRKFFQKLPIWRCAWDNPEDEKEKACFIGQSKIHFGLNRVQGKWEEGIKQMFPAYPLDDCGLFYQLKSRPFQAVGAGAMALNEYCPELEDLFEIDKEIVTFQYGDMDEFTDKLRWYVRHEKEREKIAMAGYKRGIRDHTLTARVGQIFDIIRREL